MDRFDRTTVIALATAVVLGFAVWQFLGALGSVLAEVLIDWWEGEDDLRYGTFGAELELGPLSLEYGQLLGTAITLLLAVLLATFALRRLRGRDAGGRQLQ